MKKYAVVLILFLAACTQITEVEPVSLREGEFRGTNSGTSTMEFYSLDSILRGLVLAADVPSEQDYFRCHQDQDVNPTFAFCLSGPGEDVYSLTGCVRRKGASFECTIGFNAEIVGTLYATLSGNTWTAYGNWNDQEFQTIRDGWGAYTLVKSR